MQMIANAEVGRGVATNTQRVPCGTPSSSSHGEIFSMPTK